MSKQSGFLRRIAISQENELRNMRIFTIQQAQDMSIIALNKAFGFGEKRVKEFADTLTAVWMEYAGLVLDDAKSDKDVVFSKDKVDKELKRICGKYFQDWDERYR